MISKNIALKQHKIKILLSYVELETLQVISFYKSLCQENRFFLQFLKEAEFSRCKSMAANVAT